jgi:hypothetical protein
MDTEMRFSAEKRASAALTFYPSARNSALKAAV